MSKPKPPFGPTAIEVMRSCMLRNCFEASPSYEGRLGSAARIGTALHRTLQSFNQQPIAAETTDQLAAEARRRFRAELREQQTQATSQPREQTLVWDQDRTNRALEAVIAEAIRTQPLGVSGPSVIRSQSNAQTRISDNRATKGLTSGPKPAIEVEVSVHSENNLFYGRIDRAEKTTTGIRLVDYKSAFRDDLPERYARQLQLYAYLWHETRGEWPTEALVFYPMLGSFHNVPVDSAICKQVATESTILVRRILAKGKPTDLASPGDVCKVCQFRAWCRPFWTWQNSESNQLRAFDKANAGFEGRVRTIELESNYWHLTVDWHNAQVKIIAPKERFPHLVNIMAGQHVRILDAALKGQLYQPTAKITDQSEIFIVID